MEREVVLDGGTSLNRFDLERGTDVSEQRWAEWQGLGMMLLPTLVFGAEVERAGVLKVRG